MKKFSPLLIVAITILGGCQENPGTSWHLPSVMEDRSDLRFSQVGHLKESTFFKEALAEKTSAPSANTQKTVSNADIASLSQGSPSSSNLPMTMQKKILATLNAFPLETNTPQEISTQWFVIQRTNQAPERVKIKVYSINTKEIKVEIWKKVFLGQKECFVPTDPAWAESIKQEILKQR